jgi:predicted component of type VI protein secretion system
VSHRLLVKDQQGEREVVLVDTIAVGRDPRCDVSATDPLLSRRHAEFVASGATVVVRDLNSRNGILVNGRRLAEAVLHPGDVVQIAQLAVTFLSRIEAETRFAPAGLTAPGANAAAGSRPGDDKTSLLSAAEIQAVAAASGQRSPGNGDANAAGAGNGPATNGNGTRKAGAWSVQVVADDDRTNLVSSHMPPAGDAPLDGGMPPAASLPAPAVDRAQTPTVSGPAIEPLPAAPVVPVTASKRHESPAKPSPGVSGIAVRILVLAVLCFAFGVVSTMIWLQPPLTARWLLLDHVPLAVAVAFVFILVAGGLAGLVIQKKSGRVESN